MEEAVAIPNETPKPEAGAKPETASPLKAEVVTVFRSKGKLITPDGLEYILRMDDPLGFARKASELLGDAFVKLDSLKKLEEPRPVEETVTASRPSDFKPLAKEHDADVRQFDEYDVTGKSLSTGQIEDFVQYFNDRYERLSRILRERGGGVVRDIETLKKKRPVEQVRIIGMVSAVRLTKNGHRIIDFEDPTGFLTVLVHKNETRLLQFAQRLLPDEVIAIDGMLRQDLFIAKAIHQPDLPVRQPNRAPVELGLAMMSDIHVGSKLFLEKQFAKLAEWLHGKGDARDRELAGRIKYITVAGDMCDGIGIYPSQEEQLAITDVFKQYEALAKCFEMLPDYIEIITIPGNHDATRVADPVPAIAPEALEPLKRLPNFRNSGSPSYYSLHGVEVLLYHGASMYSLIHRLPGLNYTCPEKIIPEYLQRRHLHPLYGEKPPICPEEKDYLVIERIPDIVHMGDIHRNGYINYKGVIGVNSGCWQAKTDYQKKLGHEPTPAELPIVNLASGKLSVVRFG
jgi:DNA polymerase II small subunit